MTPSRRRIGHPEAQPSVGQAEDLVGIAAARVAPRVCDDDDLELEPLRAVDREQADDVGPFLFGDGLELRGADRILLVDETHEALDVGAAQLLVGAGEPRELAQVGVAATTVPLGQDRQVVVVLDEDLLAEPLERECAARRGRAARTAAGTPGAAAGPGPTALPGATSRGRRRAGGARRPVAAGRERRSRRRRTARRAR